MIKRQVKKQLPAAAGRTGQAYLAKACGSEICVGISWPISSTEGDMAAALRLFMGESESGSPATDVGPSFGDDVESYAKAKSLELGTLKEYRTTVRKLAEWRAITSNEHRCPTPMVARDFNREVIASFFDWVYSQACTAQDRNPGRTANKAREHVGAVLQWLVDVERLDAMPRLPEKREQKNAAGLFFLTDDELDALYWATYRMHSPRGWKSPWPIGYYWRTALALFITYGVDTQLVFYVDRHATPLRWQNVYGPGLSPNRSSKQESPHGWLAWSRQKTGRQFCAPLTDVVAAHLQSIRPASAGDEDPIFGRAGGGRPCERFQELVKLAKIAEKFDTLTNSKVAWTLKDLRKTCSTRHDENLPGASSVVLGHADGSVADVTRVHYRNPGPLLFRAISTLPYPPAFRAILDDSVKPPSDLLFAK